MIIHDTLAEQVFTGQTARTQKQVATGTHEFIIPTYERTYHIFQHITQSQSLSSGLLATMRTEIALIYVSTVKTTHEIGVKSLWIRFILGYCQTWELILTTRIFGHRYNGT